MTAPLPHRSRTSGSEVVHIVEAALSGLRAERDEALALLRRVLNSQDHLAARYLPPALVEEIERVTGTP